jgi:hypothetical protein
VIGFLVSPIFLSIPLLLPSVSRFLDGLIFLSFFLLFGLYCQVFSCCLISKKIQDTDLIPLFWLVSGSPEEERKACWLPVCPEQDGEEDGVGQAEARLTWQQQQQQ